MVDSERPEPGQESCWYAIVPVRPLSASERASVEDFVDRFATQRRFVLRYAPSGDVVYMSSNNQDLLRFSAPMISDQLERHMRGRLTFRVEIYGYSSDPLAPRDEAVEAKGTTDGSGDRDVPSYLCPSCGRVLVQTTLPCPDGNPMCLVLHFREQCVICGWPNAADPLQVEAAADWEPDDAGAAAASTPGYVVITYWPDDQTDAIHQALREAGLSASDAAEQIGEVDQGGMIYLTFPSVGAAKRLATAAARVGALAEFGEVTP